jgi:hypothetical protein
MTKQKDNFVPLINPQGETEQVWDFADHVERLLAQGWTRPEEPAAKAAKNTKET